MKRIKILIALAVGVMASLSGMIQVGAALYTFNVDFSTKEVANFSAFKQTYSSTTYDLGASVTYNFSGTYNFASCPSPITVNATWEGFWQLNGSGSALDFQNAALPDFVCTTSLTLYSAQITKSLSSNFVEAVINDDGNSARLRTELLLQQNANTNGLQLRFYNYTTFITLNYNFDTTYLFNYFLSDTQATTPVRAGTWSINSDRYTKVDYVYTTAGNDEYRIINTNIGSIGTTRKKYAVNYNQEFFRGESVGARIRTGYITDAPYSYDQVTLGSSGTSTVSDRWFYYYLNTSNLAQAIVTAPIISFTEETCSGGFLDLNVGCYVNNAIAWLVNDAPVISDAFTLLNTGIELAAQTFGIIGSFSDDNVFGYLILIGFGFIAVKWFLKND